jgi:hypothetical protein
MAERHNRNWTGIATRLDADRRAAAAIGRVTSIGRGVPHYRHFTAI